MNKFLLAILLIALSTGVLKAQDLSPADFKIAGKDVVVLVQPKSFILEYTEARNRGVAEKKTVLVCKSLSGESLDNQISLAKKLDYLITVVPDTDDRFKKGCTKFVFKDGDLITYPEALETQSVPVQQPLQGQMLRYIQSPMQFGGSANCGPRG